MGLKTRRLYYPLSQYLRERFGCRVFKVTLDAGLTCPNRDGTKGEGGCIYCRPDALIPEESEGRRLSIREQLLSGIERVRMRRRAEKFIAYFQINTSTYADVRSLERFYTEALAHPDVVGITVSTRPDCLKEDTVKLLSRLRAEEKLLWVELGLQSANDDTLKFINRGHSARDFEAAVSRLKDAGIGVTAHCIIGLPGETGEDNLRTMGFLVRLGVDGVKFHQLEVVKGTPLEQMYRSGDVKTLSLEDYASIVVECLEVLPPDVVVHRLAGETPERYLVAPRWGVGKLAVIEKILQLMKERNTFQGRLSVQGAVL